MVESVISDDWRMLMFVVKVVLLRSTTSLKPTLRGKGNTKEHSRVTFEYKLSETDVSDAY